MDWNSLKRTHRIQQWILLCLYQHYNGKAAKHSSVDQSKKKHSLVEANFFHSSHECSILLHFQSENMYLRCFFQLSSVLFLFKRKISIFTVVYIMKSQDITVLSTFLCRCICYLYQLTKWCLFRIDGLTEIPFWKTANSTNAQNSQQKWKVVIDQKENEKKIIGIFCKHEETWFCCCFVLKIFLWI